MKFFVVISMLCKTEWSWELSTWSGKMSLINISTNSLYCFYWKSIGQEMRISILILGFKGLTNDYFCRSSLFPLTRGIKRHDRSTLTLIFQPRGPNFFLSWIMAWKKHIPNTSLRHVTPRTVTQRQKTNVTGLERVNQLHSLISGMLNSNHEGSTQ